MNRRPNARVLAAVAAVAVALSQPAAANAAAGVPPVEPGTTTPGADPDAVDPSGVAPAPGPNTSTPGTSTPGFSTPGFSTPGFSLPPTTTIAPFVLGDEPLDPIELAPIVPVPPLPPIEDAEAASAPLVPNPVGCPSPPAEQAVFVGTVVVHDGTTARFIVGRVRSGTLAGFTAAGLVDVRYGDEARFLDAGTTYLVGAGVDQRTGVLTSRVRAPAPLFGGNEVAGVSASDVECPAIDDPVRTLLLDGTNVESGVVTPMVDAKREVLRAILQPIGIALLVVIGLASLKLLAFAAGRSIRDIGERPLRAAVTPPVPPRRARRRALRGLGDADR